MVFALIGNQNCGKTTLFNQLTGSKQHVGNFPGVTVEKKEGMVRHQKDVSIVDLPGVYSLSPYTAEEVVTRDFLLKEKPDAIINIVDATNIERNLYLSLQLMECNVPMIIALNMMDEVRSNGGYVDVDKLREKLGVPVVAISASKNEGVDELISMAVELGRQRTLPKVMDFCSGPIHNAIHSLAHLVEDHSERAGLPKRYAATKMIEGDEPTIDELKLSDNEIDIMHHVITEMETELGTDREAALADMRYEFIEGVVSEAVEKPKNSKERERSVRIDKIVTNKYLAIPIFIAIMGLVFWLTFDLIGGTLSDLMAEGIEWLTDVTASGLEAAGVNATVRSLVIDGIFTGVGSVLSFLPLIVVLFCFLSILEDSGYMARVAFVMDKLLRKIGLSGRSFVPMLIGFGCSVPAIMATRTLPSARDRKMTIMLTPFMSCSAKIPIYALISAAFFPEHSALVMISLYLLGIVCGILSGLLFKSTIFKGEPVPFVMELPAYRFPSPRTITLHMWEKAKDFISKAFSLIFIATIIIWFLQTFNYKLDVVDSSESMLTGIGNLIAPIFRPMGFGDWRAATALIGGLTAKEAVVSTLSVLFGVSSGSLAGVLGQVFSPAAAFAFAVFTLIYTPCVAAMATVKRELGSTVQMLGVSLYQTCFAWVISFAAYNLMMLFI